MSNKLFHKIRIVTKNLYRFLTFLMKIIQFLFQNRKFESQNFATLVENRTKKNLKCSHPQFFGIDVELQNPIFSDFSLPSKIVSRLNTILSLFSISSRLLFYVNILINLILIKIIQRLIIFILVHGIYYSAHFLCFF